MTNESETERKLAIKVHPTFAATVIMLGPYALILMGVLSYLLSSVPDVVCSGLVMAGLSLIRGN